MSDDDLIRRGDAAQIMASVAAGRKRVRDAMTAIADLPAVVPGRWLSFDSAPRDGSRFFAMGGGLEAVDICSYNARVGCWDCGAVTLDDTDHEPEGYNRPALWMPLSVLALIDKGAA